MSTKHRYQFDPQIKIKEEWVNKGEVTSIVERPEHPILDAWSLAIQKQVKFNPNLFETEEMLSDFFNIKVNSIDAPKYVISYIKAYIEFKQTHRIVDFDDVLTRVTNLEIVKEEKFPNLDILIIDEAQDLSNLQWDFVDRLIQKSKKAYLSGDDDQAIMETFGAAPDRFTSFQTNVTDNQLEISYRVPDSIKNYVDLGVMKDIEKLPNRVEKKWKSDKKLKVGTVFYSEKKLDTQINTNTQNIKLSENKSIIRGMNKDYSKDTNINIEDISPDQLIEFISTKKNEEWLILCPTNASAEKLSTGMKSHHEIPHFLKNKPILNAKNDSHNINIRTIHTAKGLGADNVAIVCLSVKDIQMLGDENPKLAYVALTRAKINLYPRVVNIGVYNDANKYCNSNLQRFLLRFPKPKRLKIEDNNNNNNNNNLNNNEDPKKDIPF